MAARIGWEIYSLPLDEVDHFKATDAPHTGPTFYRAKLTSKSREHVSRYAELEFWRHVGEWAQSGTVLGPGRIGGSRRFYRGNS